MQFSAYQRTADGIWVGTHRLPLNSAIFYCKQFRLHSFNCAVAIVPDNVDPTPYLKLAESLA